MGLAETKYPTKFAHRCVVSLAVGHQFEKLWEYNRMERGLDFIREDLQKSDFSGDYIPYRQRLPFGSPTHADAPFAFKPFCLQECIESGYTSILWLDSSIRIHGRIDALFDFIEADGYLIFREFNQMSTLGEYCADGALNALGLTRDCSFSIPICWGAAIGIDINSLLGVEFQREWLRHAKERTAFTGPKWSGVYGWPATASTDRRVHGHRWDQTVASVLAWRLGMRNWQERAVFDRYLKNDRLAVRRYSEWKDDNFLKKMWRKLRGIGPGF